jgi:hypothetical protein
MSPYSLRKREIEINKYKKLHNFYKYFNVSNKIHTLKRSQKPPNDYLEYLKKVINSILMKEVESKKGKLDNVIRFYVERKAHRFLRETYKINRFFKSTTLLDDFKIPKYFGSNMITNFRISDWTHSSRVGIIPCGIGLKFDIIKNYNFSKKFLDILEKLKN